VPASLPVEDTSTPDVVGQGVLTVSSVMRHGVISVGELTAATVGRQGVVLLPLSLDVSVPYADEHGVLAFMVLCSVTAQEVTLLSLTSAELTVTCVDRQGVLSMSRLAEDVPV